MNCPSCGVAASDDAKFCSGCGASLVPLCPSCGHSNAADARFCDQCGTDLTAAPTGGEAASDLDEEPKPEDHRAEKAAREGGRKSVTVLFADVVGFTSLSEGLDAEEADDIMRPCFDLMRETVNRYGGTVSQFLGDGIMALFGAPLALEDHAERGVLAALSTQKALKKFDEELAQSSGVSIRMRIGLNSGNVVVGTIGTDLNPTFTAMGDTVNLASRIEGLAPAGSVAISENTERLVRGSFLTRDMGAHEVKGKEAPVNVYEVIRPTARTSSEPNRSRLIGRDQQLQTMMGRYDDARAGRGQVVLVSGEPGIGKSRLLEEFRHRAGATAPVWMAGQCVSYGSDTPYLPVVDLLRRLVELEDSDSEATVVSKVESYAASLNAELGDGVLWLKFLLSVETGDRAVAAIDASIRKVRVFEALRSLVLAHANEDPVVLVIEDLHWMDEVSQEFISFLLGAIHRAPVMVVLTHRPEYQQPFGSFQNMSKISLSSLAGRDSDDLAAEVLGTSNLPVEVAELVSARAEGNPFFIQEVIRSLLEDGSIRRTGSEYTFVGDIEHLSIPATVQDVIAARLDRLDTGTLEVIRTAAFIGMEFSADTLAAACEPSVQTTEAIAALKAAELVSEGSLYPELTYTFHHALVRDVVIESLLKPRRRSLHLAVAEALERSRPDRLIEQVEVLAHHYEEAEAWPEAANFLIRSGQKALQAAAPSQAEGFFQRTLDIFERVPDAIASKDLISLHRGMGQARQLGGRADRAINSFKAMLEAATAAGDGNNQGRALLDLVGVCIWAHRFEDAQQYAEIARKAAVEADSGAMLAGTRYAVAFMAGLTGEMAAGRVAADEAVEAAQRPDGGILKLSSSFVRGLFHHWDGEETRATKYFDEMLRLSRQPEGMSSLTRALFFKAMSCCGEGDYVTALACLNEGFGLATKLDDQPQLTRNRNTLGWVYHDLCNFDAAIEENLLAVRIAQELGDPETISFGHLNLSDCYLELGQLDEAEAHLNPVIEESRRDATLGDQWMRWRYTQHLNVNLGWLALRRGQHDEALRKADECVEAAKGSGSPRNVTKGLRLRGVVLGELGRFDEASTALTAGLDAARKVGNPCQTWRTLAALSDLSHTQGLDDQSASFAKEALTVVDEVATSLDEGPLRDGLLTSEVVTGLRSWAAV